MMRYEDIPLQRQFRIGMTPEERANHEPGKGVDPKTFTLNTRSLADVYIIVPHHSSQQRQDGTGYDWILRR